MGVRSLWKILQPCMKKPVLTGKVLAVDASIWLYQYKNIPDAIVVVSIAKRILRTLYSGIRPVFVFDGTPPYEKRVVLEQRRKNEMRLLLRRLIRNRKCEECGELLRNCKHINDFDVKKMEEMNREALSRLQNHKYNWGEQSVSEESEEMEETTSQASGGSGRSSAKVDTSIANFDYRSIEGLTRQEQLQKLMELRALRGRAMPCNNSDFLSFSTSQLKNVKCRNKITELIRDLNKSNKKRIQSDCTVYSELRKDKKDEIYRTFSCVKEPVSGSSVKADVEQSSELEDLFEAEPVGGWEEIFERYDRQPVRDVDISGQVEYNRAALMNAVPVNPLVMRKAAQERMIAVISDVETQEEQAVAPPATEEESQESTFDLQFSSSEEEAKEWGSVKVESNKLAQGDLQRVQMLIIGVLNAFELPYIEAIGESDAQCGYLFRRGLIDGVISEDNDMLIYGATVYRNFFRNNKDIVSVSLDDVKDQLKIDQDGLIKISYLLGSDYCPGVKGVGPRTVFAKIDSVEDAQVAFLHRIYECSDVKKIDEIIFGSLDIKKVKDFLIDRGIDVFKIDEITLHCKKVVEMLSGVS